MESWKQGTSDASSEESDRVDEVKSDMAATTKRSYECTFCKRGFTNAQALGGHMNIHRKDRAKAKHKQPTSSSIPSEPMNENYMNPRYGLVPPDDDQPTRQGYYPIMEAAQRNYHIYFQQLASSPRLPQSFMSMNEEALGANLSLGPTNVDESEVRRAIMKEDEVDLELRLGQNP